MLVCRKISVSNHHPQGSSYCKFCRHYSLTDEKQRCVCCLNKIVRERKYYSDLRKFEQIIEQNQNLIDVYLKHPYQVDYMPGFVVKLGYKTYLVNIKHLAEYMKFENQRNLDLILPLLTEIKQNSTLLMPGTRVV